MATSRAIKNAVVEDSVARSGFTRAGMAGPDLIPMVAVPGSPPAAGTLAGGGLSPLTISIRFARSIALRLLLVLSALFGAS